MADRIGISFTITTENDAEISAIGIPHYADTLWFDTMEELAGADIEALKQERYQNWRGQVLNPPVVEQVAPTRDEALIQAQESLRQAQEAIGQILSSSE